MTAKKRVKSSQHVFLRANFYRRPPWSGRLRRGRAAIIAEPIMPCPISPQPGDCPGVQCVSDATEEPVCFICLEGGSVHRLCRCSTAMHIDCQVKMIKSTPAHYSKCAVCLMPYANVAAASHGRRLSRDGQRASSCSLAAWASFSPCRFTKAGCTSMHHVHHAQMMIGLQA